MLMFCFASFNIIYFWFCENGENEGYISTKHESKKYTEILVLVFFVSQNVYHLALMYDLEGTVAE